MGVSTVISALLFCALAVGVSSRRRQKLSLPPGPPAEPIIGHLRRLPDEQVMAEVFHEWSQKYGM